jgi:RNA 3'-terminal phosphate cyclase (ATP)
LMADAPSTLHISGGTHNPMAPPVQFLQRAYGRLLGDMGAQIDLHLERFGFYPAGGGEVAARVEPCVLQPREWITRGGCRDAYAESFVAGVPAHVAQRELEYVGQAMGWGEEQLHARQLPGDQGPGNVLLLTLDYEHVTEVFAAFGEKSVSAEQVARHAVQRARRYLASNAAVSEYLADQLMLPLALAGGERFTVDEVSLHARTNAGVIEQFLPVRFEFTEEEGVPVCTLRT